MKFIINSLVAILMTAGCSIQLHFDTDYASQSQSSGNIEESMTSSSDATVSPEVSTDVSASDL